MYRLLFTLFLQRIEAERAHALAAAATRVLTRAWGVGWGIRSLLRPRDPALRISALGRQFPSPVGVAAGVDKDASWFDGLGALGFGHVEIGTVTAKPQPGQERPRVFRLAEERALKNRMGFPNPGARVVAARLQRRRDAVLVGANIGKTRDVTLDDAAADYSASVHAIREACDYVVINISSPNTPGLRALQAPERIREVLVAVKAELEGVKPALPVLIKIGPDLTDDEIDELCDVALLADIDGIVAVNTTVDHEVLGASRTRAEELGPGGISGAPLKNRAVEVLQRLRSRVGDRMILISVGGIEAPEDAWIRFLAGATLVQAHTGFVYGGPLWAHRMNRGIADLLRSVGASHLSEVIGSASDALTEDTAEGLAPTADNPTSAAATRGVPPAVPSP